MIVGIAGSGREDGTSSRLLHAALNAAETKGFGPTRSFRLGRLRFTGCVGCAACRQGASGCVLRDDLTPVLEATAGARALVLATPIYYGYATGLFKSFLDRWYSFRDADRMLRIPANRPALLILTQGNADPEAYGWTIGSLQKVLSAYGHRPRVLVASGLGSPGDLEQTPHWLAEAQDLGAEWLGTKGPDET